MQKTGRQVLHNSYRLERRIQGVTNAFASPGFWLKDTKSACRILADRQKIQAYNRRLLHQKESPLTDLTEHGEQISAKKVRRLIESAGLEGVWYLDGEILTDAKRALLQKKRNLEPLFSEKEITVSWGLVIRQADVRAYPSWAALTKSRTDREFDHFQETALKVGEGVCIYHAAADRTWFFVQAQNYAGWVLAENIAVCAKKEMEKYLTAEPFAVITSRTETENNGERVHLAMGCRLPKAGKNMALVPGTKDGNLVFTKISLNPEKYYDGYLPYTTAHVLDQAMKLLNIPYGWGNRRQFLDCSSAMLSVYSCFGFSLPRNTFQLTKCRERAYDVGGSGREEKKRLLTDILPGSLLIMNGHVMLYLGIRKENVYVLHAFSGYYNEDGRRENVMACTITPLSIKRENGDTFLDAVHTVLEILPADEEDNNEKQRDTFL